MQRYELQVFDASGYLYSLRYHTLSQVRDAALYIKEMATFTCKPAGLVRRVKLIVH